MATDEEILKMWNEGSTMTDIAAQIGLTRERVRQRLKRQGIAGRNKQCPYTSSQLLDAVRDGGTVVSAAETLSVSSRLLEAWIDTLDLTTQVELLIEEGRRSKRNDKDEEARSRILLIIASVHEETGETPRIQELAPHGVYPATLIRYFGSTFAAMQAAGLKPRRALNSRDTFETHDSDLDEAHSPPHSTSGNHKSDTQTNEDRNIWRFVPKLPQQTVHDPVHEEFFADDAIRGVCDALVREGIQNSLDAKATSSVPGPVLVRLGVRAPQDSNDGYAVRRKEFLSGIYRHWNASGNGLRGAPTEGDPIHWLIFEDFGTTGLTGNPGQDFAEAESNAFFSFFRADGFSDKHSSQRGRWGLGKFAFPRASRGRCVFGLSVREDDGRRLLMGRCTLKSHRIGNEKFTSDGYFGIWSDDTPVMPFEDDTILDAFSSAFDLARDDARPGLSIVVPFVDPDDVTTRSLLSATIRGYWYAILSGDLEVRLVEEDGTVIDITAASLDDVLARLSEKEQELIQPLIALTRWGIQRPQEEVIRTEIPRIGATPRWSTDTLPTGTISQLQTRAEIGRWKVRVPVRIRRARSDRFDESYFEVLLERLNDGLSYAPVFIREGIWISDVLNRTARGWRSVVLVDEGTLGTFLGDSENPAHTRWVAQGTHFKGKYDRGSEWLSFVRNSVGYIIDQITASDTTADASVLADILALVMPEAPQKTKRRAPTDRPTITDKPTVALPRSKMRYRLDQVRGGVSISNSDEAIPAGYEISLFAAYDVRNGNPFSQWQAFDFEMNRLPIRLAEQNGVDVVECRENYVKFRTVAPVFRLVVNGFDEWRDVKVEVRVRGASS